MRKRAFEKKAVIEFSLGFVTTAHRRCLPTHPLGTATPKTAGVECVFLRLPDSRSSGEKQSSSVRGTVATDGVPARYASTRSVVQMTMTL